MVGYSAGDWYGEFLNVVCREERMHAENGLYPHSVKEDIVYDVIVAAALCAEHDTLPRQLDYRLIQDRLDEMDVNL